MFELRRLADLPVRMRLAVNGAWTDDHERLLGPRPRWRARAAA